jgi:predicted PurR-regulated permease PerM
MNTTIATTLISVLGAGLFGMFFVLFRNLFTLFRNLSNTMTTGFSEVYSRFDGLVQDVHALDIKFTGEIRALETKLTDKFTAELRAHGERLARIESKLEPDPPAEAA